MFREREKCLYKRKILTVIAPIDLSETRIAEVVVSSPIFSGASLIDFADIVSQSATTTALSRTGWVEKNFFAAEQMMTHFILPKKEREREMSRRRGEQFFNLPSCLSFFLFFRVVYHPLKVFEKVSLRIMAPLKGYLLFWTNACSLFTKRKM